MYIYIYYTVYIYIIMCFCLSLRRPPSSEALLFATAGAGSAMHSVRRQVTLAQQHGLFRAATASTVIYHLLKAMPLGKKWKRFENLLENSLNLMTKHIFAYFCQSGVIKHGDDSWKIHGWGKSLSINGGSSRSPCDKVTCQTRHDGFVSRMPFIFCRKNDWQSSLKEHF